jgi:hypothetical protein
VLALSSTNTTFVGCDEGERSWRCPRRGRLEMSVSPLHGFPFVTATREILTAGAMAVPVPRMGFQAIQKISILGYSRTHREFRNTQLHLERVTIWLRS